jgi:MFS family permease
VLIHTARIAGPMFAGGTIALLGVAPCFLVNALSFAAMLVALRGMDPAGLHTTERAERKPGQVRAAIAEVRRRPDLRIPLLMMAVIGTLSFNFQVLLPLFAKFTWHGTATTYATLMAAMGVGSILGALVAGWRGNVTARLLVGSATAFGAAQLLAAAAPTQAVQMLVLALTGAASVTFAAGVNSSLQLAAGPLRGRVMALYSVVFLGSTPIGAPLVGLLAEHGGPRWGFVLGGTAALATAAWAAIAYRGPMPTSNASWMRRITSSSAVSSSVLPWATRRETTASVAPTAARYTSSGGSGSSGNRARAASSVSRSSAANRSCTASRRSSAAGPAPTTSIRNVRANAGSEASASR